MNDTMNYQELETMIDHLRVHVHETDPHKGYWSELWTLARQISAGFKGVHYETREAREAAWKRFQELCAEAKQKGDANRREMEVRQKEWEQRKTRSEQTRSSIEGTAAGARPLSGLERSIGEIVLLPLTMIELVLGKLLGLRAKTEFEEVRNELHHCGEKLQEAWRAFTDHKRELLPADKAHCYQTLTRAQERLNEAWTRLKQAQDRFYVGQKAAHEQRQREWDEKQRDFRERVRANIEKLEGNLQKAADALARQESHLEKLENDHSNARSDSYRERVSGWIEEAKAKIADIRASIERIKGWLNDERDKLR